MRILFICHRLPYPPNRGGKIRPFNMIRHLGQKHSVVVASLAHSEQEYVDGAGLNDYCDEVIAEILPQSTRWLQVFRALPTLTPSSVAYFRSARLHDRIREESPARNSTSSLSIAGPWLNTRSISRPASASWTLVTWIRQSGRSTHTGNRFHLLWCIGRNLRNSGSTKEKLRSASIVAR